jgi:tRNA A37 threonylcarbamoyladenosine synthetase subunit TsaC/SUA5/YrdC
MSSPLVAEALHSGAVVGLPGVGGGYVLAVQAGSPEREARLLELAPDVVEPHYAAGSAADVRALTSNWTDELARLLERCWPGPLEITVVHPRPGPSGPRTVTVGTPHLRALRRLCRTSGPWRTAHVATTDARATAQLYAGSEVRLVVDGGECHGPPLTLVDATSSPLRVVHEGALPSSFIEAAMLMGARRRRLWRSRRPGGPSDASVDSR